MARKEKKRKSTSSKKQRPSTSASSSGQQQWLLVDPARIRFQHSRIRPYFSGCGRSVQETLESIRRKELSPSDLPPIQVIVGPEDEDGDRWYFSLNNRRLWVLKRCGEEGLLENNLIRVRVRQPRSGGEEERYTLENCSLEAKFIREKDPKPKEVSEHSNADISTQGETSATQMKNRFSESGITDMEMSIADPDDRFNEQSTTSESDDDASEAATSSVNRFSALML